MYDQLDKAAKWFATTDSHKDLPYDFRELVKFAETEIYGKYGTIVKNITPQEHQLLLYGVVIGLKASEYND